MLLCTLFFSSEVVLISFQHYKGVLHIKTTSCYKGKRQNKQHKQSKKTFSLSNQHKFISDPKQCLVVERGSKLTLRYPTLHSNFSEALYMHFRHFEHQFCLLVILIILQSHTFSVIFLLFSTSSPTFSKNGPGMHDSLYIFIQNFEKHSTCLYLIILSLGFLPGIFHLPHNNHLFGYPHPVIWALCLCRHTRLRTETHGREMSTEVWGLMFPCFSSSETFTPPVLFPSTTSRTFFFKP